MTELQRLTLKLYADVGSDFSPARVVPVFHALIRERSLKDEVLIDVADYSHVHDGPGVVLIGHGSDYYLDLGEGRPGLVYARKREGPSETEALVKDAFGRALAAAQLLEQSPDLGLRFRTDELRLSVPDRLRAPPADATLAALGPALARALAAVYGDVRFELAREGGDKEPFTVRVRAAGAPDVASLLARHGG